MIFAVIVPIFLLLSLGFLSVKSHLLDHEHIATLGIFVIKVALPALFLHVLAAKEIQEIWHTEYFVAYTIVSLFLFALSFIVMQSYFKNSVSDSSILSVGAAMSNTGLIGTAVLTLLIGQKALTYTTLVVIIESVILIPLVLAVAAIGMQQSTKLLDIIQHIFLTLVRSPLFVGIMLGIVCAFFEWRIPIYLDQVLMLLGQCASPLALFIIGAGVASMNLKYVNLQTLYLVISGNFFMPMIMFLTLKYCTNVSQEMLHVGTLIAALPMPSLYVMLGQSYGLQAQTLTPLLMSTVIGFIVTGFLITLWW